MGLLCAPPSVSDEVYSETLPPTRVGGMRKREKEVIPMLWCVVQNPILLAVTWPLSTLVLPVLAIAVAAVPIGVVAYKTFVRELPCGPGLRVLEGGRTKLRLKPA